MNKDKTNVSEGETLADFGERTARSAAPDGSFPARREARRVRAALRALLSARAGEGGAAAYLADNRYLAEREALCAMAEFSVRTRLRAGRAGALVCEAADALCLRCSGAVGPEEAREFFAGFQRVTPLTLDELGLLCSALRASLIVRLAAEFSLPEPDEGLAGRCIESLRALASAEFSGLAEGLDVCAGILAGADGVYALMDEPSRALYRRRLAGLARREGMSEPDCARRVAELAAAHDGDARRGHVGWWLFIEPLARPRRARSGALCAAACALAACALAAGAGLVSGGLITAALALLPAFDMVRAAHDALLLRVLPPRVLPRMELAGGVPGEGRTVCAVFAVLSAPEDGAKIARRLETFRCAARDCGENLLFAMLCDLPEAAGETLEGDAAVIEAARAAVDALNRKYSGGFFLLTRARSENRRDGLWTPRERKRGALMALAELCAGRESELKCLAGEAGRIAGARYIIALDADTTLLPGSARELIGAMLHPLNRAVLDRERRVVAAGRGIIHPRVSVELAASERTRFSRTVAGPGGVDPYGTACGELWMDLTGRGGFAGKGIIDVEALLVCCSGLPENLVLSHDAIEGALLRGGYMGASELTDGFPASPAAYLKRQHRWVRGDWQNLAVLRRLRGRVSAADRLRLYDSVRRSLSPAAAALAIALAGFFPALYPAAALAAISLCAGLPGALMRALFRRSGREKHPGGALYGAALCLSRLLIRLAFLPWEAWTNLSAACTALWRVHVSHRRLLQWQTSAQAASGTAGALLLSAWPQLLLGAALLALSPEPAGKTLGVIYMAALPMALPLGAAARRAAPLPRESRRFLLDGCAKLWRYFDELCTPARGFLPPDNFQAQPPVGAAERTSPTNIGLALVSCLAAIDLGLAEPERALTIAEGLIATCERLEKRGGHLYNWYSLATLRPIEPRIISTVDSGNLAACLAAAAAGLREYGRGGLAGRCDRLREGMDFSLLYDERRRLFRISLGEDGRASEGCYDLLASEARLTAYYAVAHGDVPARHWRQLSRALLGRDGYRGLASWTGTMFEYLMPELFLPLERGSLLYESARFCLYVQRRDVPEGAPWGQSESAFFALDESMSYAYKAHGCASLALQRGMDADTVCAPYASYLALAVAPGAALRNLKRFAALDAGGRYGLWEAVDFTPRRCAGKGGEQVRSAMAHHTGMSLIAAANCLLDGVFVRRFMSGPDMAAFEPLLCERAPEGAVTLRRRAFSRPKGPGERRAVVFSDSAACESTDSPRVYALSNGVYSLLVSAAGRSRASAGGVLLYRGLEAAASGPAGLRLSFGGMELPDAAAGGVCSLAGGLLRFSGARDGLEYSLSCGVSARDTAELRVLELRSDTARRGRLVCEFEPALAREADYFAHPAYWRLGVRAESAGGALLLRRLPRSGAPGCWLCLASDAACAFRANIDGAPLGWLSHPYVTASLPVEIGPGESFRVRFALAFGADRAGALDAARRALVSGAAQLADLTSTLGGLYGLGREELAPLPELAGRLIFPRSAGRAGPREELWAAGISGDLPVIAARVEPPETAALCARHALMRACGVRADLAVLTGDGEGYGRQGRDALRRALAAAGLETLLGARGGIYAVDAKHAAAVEASCALRLSSARTLPPRGRGVLALPPPGPWKRRGGQAEHEYRGGEFRFTVRGRLPRRAWCLPMANEGFGYIAADCGLGCMWAKNAREERINAWLCDERALEGPETLRLETPEGAVSLFAAEDGLECRVRFGPGYAVWEKSGARVTAFVPLDAAARILIIENAPGRVVWHSSLQLAAEARDGIFTVTRPEKAALTAENPRGGMSFAAAFSEEADAFTCDEAAFRAGRLGGEHGAGLAPCFAAAFNGCERLVIACGCCGLDELRRLARYENAAVELERVRARSGRLCTLRIAAGIPELDRYAGRWAVYQVLACRILARASLYQSGGAFGFRDQLQDAANLLFLEPGIARGRIIDCCAHQYDEGDVMHWWHPGEPDRGVRTRISDDLLWLPWAVCEYMDAGGGAELLRERVRGISSPPLAGHERSRYESAAPGREASVLEHAAAAFKCVLARGFGPHGLLKMGSGDWCDAFDEVGGESVWLTEFFAHTAKRFLKYLDTPSAAVLSSAARRCLRAVEAAWDGGWYRRGYYEDGAPLGSKESRGCKIDLVAQAWAVFAGCDGPRTDAALTSALEQLFDESGGLTRLFAPPFGEGTERAGYVNGYGPGFRENGGQYTHAALWLALALLERGRTEEARRVLRGVMVRGEAYGAEPFVLAADVYSAPERFGEAGWSWYTGSAGWCLRAARALAEVDGKFTKESRKG